MKNVKETVMHGIFLGAACASILAVALICVFLFANGLPAIAKIGPISFLTGMKWKPMNEIFGIFPMIIGSIYVTAGAILVGVPIGILCAVYMARFCPKRLYPLQKLLGTSGKGVITASLLLGIMILPTIINVSESALRAVPESLLAGVRTLTANIVLEMGYAAGLHREALIATGVVLFVFILLINMLFSLVKRRESHG